MIYAYAAINAQSLSAPETNGPKHVCCITSRIIAFVCSTKQALQQAPDILEAIENAA